jgi:hypothetical protein
MTITENLQFLSQIDNDTCVDVHATSIASKYAAIDRNESGSPSSASSVSSNCWLGDSCKRKIRDDGMSRVSDRIPKRPKNQGGHPQMKATAPNSDGRASYVVMKKYHGSSEPFSRQYLSKEYYGPFDSQYGRDTNCCKGDEPIVEDISLSIVLHRHDMWTKFLNYEPKTKCVPTDTYL